MCLTLDLSAVLQQAREEIVHFFPQKFLVIVSD